MAALENPESTTVRAGPGSGKTEFLAQKATYLLEQGICQEPRRILAISFKRSSAQALSERVESRLERKLAWRFESRTFDSFSKYLVDRFRSAFPDQLHALRTKYQLHPRIEQSLINSFLSHNRRNLPDAFRTQSYSITSRNFLRDVIGTWELSPTPLSEATSAIDYLAMRWWHERLRDHPGPIVDFTMINRMAEHLVRTQPNLVHALKATYAHIFVDEFQDTTGPQYQLLTRCFAPQRLMEGRPPRCESHESVVTMVGDERQRIMGFAGAEATIFDMARRDFAAQTFALLRNHRSIPPLVYVQKCLENAWLPTNPPDRMPPPTPEVAASVEFRRYASEAEEAEGVARLAQHFTRAPQQSLANVAILARSHASDWFDRLNSASRRIGLSDVEFRLESQDLGGMSMSDVLSSAAGEFAIQLLRRSIQQRDPAADRSVRNRLTSLLRAGDQEGDDSGPVRRRIDHFSFSVSRILAENDVSTDGAVALIAALFELLEEIEWHRSFPEISTLESSDLLQACLANLLSISSVGASCWDDAIYKATGKGAVPIMSIHASKGLEFETVVLVGMNDGAWMGPWDSSSDNYPTLFVGFSRARRRVFMTTNALAQRHRISELYTTLQSAGIAFTTGGT